MITAALVRHPSQTSDLSTPCQRHMRPTPPVSGPMQSPRSPSVSRVLQNVRLGSSPSPPAPVSAPAPVLDSLPGPSTPPSRPPSRTERKFVCNVEGCGKSYFKPSRLAEHQLSHTGERPHKCSSCGQTYQRTSHLAAHMRTHRDPTERKFTCNREGCGKSFWTATHLRRHEQGHDTTEIHSCTTCGETFSKTHLLRKHFTSSHMPQGSKPFPCTHKDCGRTFTTRQHQRAHEKTHDPTRYTCSHPSHEDNMPSFPTWSSLQTHIHQAHPPNCPYPECSGRVFKSTQRLRDHLKVHEDHVSDMLSNPPTPKVSSITLPPVLAEALSSNRRRRKINVAVAHSVVGGIGGGESGGVKKEEEEVKLDIKKSSDLALPKTCTKLTRRLDGIAGKDYSCHCGKAFKSKFARDEHARAEHDGKRHICVECGAIYRRRASLRRHRCGIVDEEGDGDEVEDQIKCQRKERQNLGEIQRNSDERVKSENDFLEIIEQRERKRAKRVQDDAEGASMDLLIGTAYAPGGIEHRRWSCPFRPNLFTSEELVKAEKEEERCPERFHRVYDVRRHLGKVHGVVLDDLATREMLLDDGQTGE